MECMRRHALRVSELVDLGWKQISLDTVDGRQLPPWRAARRTSDERLSPRELIDHTYRAAKRQFSDRALTELCTS